MDTRDKKFLAPILRTYKEDISKRWRVEYWTPTHNGHGIERVVLYGNINKGTTPEDRHRLANELIASLQLQRPQEKTMMTKVMEAGRLEWRTKTISTYKTVVLKYETFLHKQQAELASSETINQFLRDMQDKGAKVGTIFKYRYILYALYERAVAMKLCSVNPVEKVAQMKREPQSLAYFSTAQIYRIKRECEHTQLWLSIRLLFYCFIRPGEQRLLRVGDINFEQSYIEIRAEISKNRKTQKVAIPAHFLEEIQYLKQYSNNTYVISRSGAPGDVCVAANWMNNEHSKVLNKLQIRGNYAVYSWKHTGVVACVKAGLNIRDIQNQLRHHSLDMVQEYLKGLGVLQSEDLMNRYPKL